MISFRRKPGNSWKVDCQAILIARRSRQSPEVGGSISSKVISKPVGCRKLAERVILFWRSVPGAVDKQAVTGHSHLPDDKAPHDKDVMISSRVHRWRQLSHTTAAKNEVGMPFNPLPEHIFRRQTSFSEFHFSPFSGCECPKTWRNRA